ncbi:MAG: heavy-metal-associated domain-containing protein [Burkholderiales bacterium]|jgi:hypothetical protein|nr:heavy-metal-associated domain-containing protein [Burkholderiales bacterium]
MEENFPTNFAHHLACAVRIAHHISGRVRLKLIDDSHLRASEKLDVKTIGKNLPYIMRQLENILGIRSITVNLLARSCVVEYDVNLIPDSAWTDLLSEKNSPEARTLLDALMSKSQEIRKELTS